MPVTSKPQLRHDLHTVMDEDIGIKTPLINGLLAPEMKTKHKSASVPVKKAGETEKIAEDTRRNKNGSFNRSTIGYGEDSYYTEFFGHETQFDMIEKLELDEYFDLEFDHMQAAMQIIKLGRERRVISAVQNEAAYTTNNAASVIDAEDVYANHATSDPVKDFKALSDQTYAQFGLKKDMCWCTIQVDLVDDIIQAEKLKATSVYTSDMQAASRQRQEQYLKDVLKVGRVILVDGRYNASGINQEVNWQQFWSDTSISMFAPPSTGNTLKTPSFLRQPVYTKYANDLKLESYPEWTHRQMVMAASEYRGLKQDYKYAVMLKGTAA